MPPLVEGPISRTRTEGGSGSSGAARGGMEGRSGGMRKAAGAVESGEADEVRWRRQGKVRGAVF